ncbi:MAG TPA: hypothetical protein PKX02_05345 [Candidatus Sabulitectum sp.]|nr:hypothetical protein [Candidatus Sabulitectum sp.]
MHPGLIGGIVGGVLGVAGGLIGTAAALRSAGSPGERRFIRRASILFWAVSAAFILLFLIIPRPFNFLLWIPWGVFLPLFIRNTSRRLGSFRNNAAETHGDPP